jgi:lipopolysaccharide transport protein LptA
MKRRLLLLVGSFVLVLLTFLVYRAFDTEPPEPPPPAPDAVSRPADMPQPGPGPLQARTGTDLEIVDRDSAGRLRGVYTAQQWDKLPDDRFRLDRPHVTLYLKGGRQTIITARRGLIHPQDVAGSLNVRRGRLSGDVRIYFDRSRQPDRPPPEQRLDEVVRVYTEQIEFDNELLEIHTDRRVTLFSAEADIYGRGLTIAWNEGLGEESERELRLLQVDEGEYIAVYTEAEEIADLSLAGDEEPVAETRPTTAPAETQPATAPAETQPASAPSAVATAPATAPATRPATMPGPTTQPAPHDKPRNIYRAVFHGGHGRDVRVYSAEGSIEGADRLSITFQWEGELREDEPEAAPAPRRPARPTTTTTQATRPTQPAEEEPPQPLEVYWTGPLIIRPQGYTSAPSGENYTVSAEGDRVALAGDGNAATCRRMVYEHSRQRGLARLEGTAETPAEIELAEGERILCREARFDSSESAACLRGPGRLLQPVDVPEAKAASQPATRATTQPAEPLYDTIAFEGEVTARFARNEEGERQIREAVFTGGVELTRAATGDTVCSEELHVWTARAEDGSLYASRAVAAGSVRAVQGGDEIEADKATLWFSPEREPVRLLAEGSVVVRTRAEPGEEPTVATAERMEAWPEKGEAVLAGGARAARGSNVLSGDTIRLNDRKRTLEVPGAGTLAFTFDRDLSGSELSEPRPGEIRWQESMEYRGETETAEFRGDVTLTSGQDRLECGHMRIFFAAGERGEQETPSAQPAEDEDGRQLGLGMESYSDRRIRLILAREDVLLRSQRTGTGAALLRRLQLRGKRLNYDVTAAEVNVYEPGTLLVEDYRPPEAGEGDGGVERPYQTLFTWNDSMQLSQTDRLVVMTGDVKMVHLSGQKLQARSDLLEGVPHPPWPDAGMPSGRRAALTCEKLMARFEEPPKDETPTTAPAEEPGGPAIGPLELFTATQDVNLKLNEAQIQGERMMYHRANDLAVVWGYLEGQPRGRAQLDYEEPETGRRTTVRSSRITAFIRGGQVYRVETGPAEASGGR